MKLNKLYKGDLRISEIGLGAMSFMQGHESTNEMILELASDYGINYLDTSDLYDKGKNEELIGRLLQGKRQDWVLASKVGNKWRSDGSGWDWVPSKKHILSAVEESLGRLKTDYLDLYQLHGGTLDDPFDEIVEAFELLKEQGKIKEYGISSIRPNVFLKYAEKSQIVSNMMQYSLLDRRPEEYFSKLKEEGIAVFARGTVAQGLMLNKPAQKYLSIPVHQVLKIQKAVEETAKELNVSAMALALKYPLLHEPVLCSVVGIRTKAQAQELGKAIDEMERLSLSDYEQIMAFLPEIKYAEHRR